MKIAAIKKKMTQKDAKKNKFKVGELCFCYYPTGLNAENPYELDLFFCKITHLGDWYSTCKIYYGEEPDKLRLRGDFNDVCTADLKKIH